MTRDEKLERIKSRQWYHSIDVEDGLVTPGAHSVAELRHALERLQLPARLDGLSVLDIGAWDGYFSFEAERRGARRVVAYDVSPVDYFGFATARELLGSKVEFVQGSVYDLRKEEHKKELLEALLLGEVDQLNLLHEEGGFLAQMADQAIWTVLV